MTSHCIVGWFCTNRTCGSLLITSRGWGHWVVLLIEPYCSFYWSSWKHAKLSSFLPKSISNTLHAITTPGNTSPNFKEKGNCYLGGILRIRMPWSVKEAGKDVWSWRDMPKWVSGTAKPALARLYCRLPDLLNKRQCKELRTSSPHTCYISTGSLPHTSSSHIHCWQGYILHILHRSGKDNYT